MARKAQRAEYIVKIIRGGCFPTILTNNARPIKFASVTKAHGHMRGMIEMGTFPQTGDYVVEFNAVK